jgi:antitoxin HicB
LQMKTKVPKNKISYLKMPYTRELIRNEDGTWFARIVEFTGCMTEGDTQAEALAMLDDAMKGWIDVQKGEKNPIPEPLDARNFSGKFLVRVPPTLHRDLVRTAEVEGVSLNQLVATALARTAAKRSS